MKKHYVKRLAAIVLSIMLVVTMAGCNRGKEAKDSSGKKNQKQFTGYGENISVEDMKLKYNQTEDGVMPLYNIEPDESFDIQFKSNLLTSGVVAGFCTVHTDAACGGESLIYIGEDVNPTEDGGSTLTISPIQGALTNESEDKLAEEKKWSWGSAPIYYICLYYDTESKEVKEREEPLIIPFTVKHEVKAPSVHSTIGKDGRLQLNWDAVEGAEAYKVYHLVTLDQTTGVENNKSSGAKKGYSDSFFQGDAVVTTGTSFEDFDGVEKGIDTYQSTYTKELLYRKQNVGVGGEYYVSAVVDGKESGFASAVETYDMKLPYEVALENEIADEIFGSVKELPLSIPVNNIDGSVTNRNVIYTLIKESLGNEFEKPRYSYVIDGTVLNGIVAIETQDFDTLPETIGEGTTGGNAGIDNQMEQSPDPELPTIIPTNNNEAGQASETEGITEEQISTTEEAVIQEQTTEAVTEEQPEVTTEEAVTEELPEETTETVTEVTTEEAVTEEPPEATTEQTVESDKDLIQQQQENTQKHVEKGNQKTVSNPGKDVVIFAESAEEEWIATNMVNAQTDISLQGFPSLQTANVLEDTLYKVYYQNPYIMGMYAFSYDYGSMTLKIAYNYSAEEIKQRQQEITAEAQNVVSQVVKDGMSPEEKQMALYNYLEQNCAYDTEALEDAETKGYQKTTDNTHEDAFNTYGILVKKKGVCQSYAYTYKLLCHLCDVKCLVMTGFLNSNLPHAWNMVQLGDKWYQVDTTNNGATTGIPYFLYNADSEVAELTGFTPDMNFALDSDVNTYETQDATQEYYAVNQLVADSMDSYEQILDRVLTGEEERVSIRYNGSFDEAELVQSVQTVYSKHGLDSQLAELGYIYQSGYIILSKGQSDASSE
ncbi:MAG: hypothetical protein J6D02_10635 [Lachnospira sp.]|nr:hypothetical protein [Lachnospira sp.]